jgi:hypothetical protein
MWRCGFRSSVGEAQIKLCELGEKPAKDIIVIRGEDSGQRRKTAAEILDRQRGGVSGSGTRAIIQSAGDSFANRVQIVWLEKEVPDAGAAHAFQGDAGAMSGGE